MRCRLRGSLPLVRQRTSAHPPRVCPRPTTTLQSPPTTTLQACNDVASMRRHCKHATTLQACGNVASIRRRCKHAATFQAFGDVSSFSRFISMG
jgi:hypothetical protein